MLPHIKGNTSTINLISLSKLKQSFQHVKNTSNKADSKRCKQDTNKVVSV